MAFQFFFLPRTCVILLQETSSHCLLSLLLFLFLSSQTDFNKQNSPKKRFHENWLILLSKKLLDKMNFFQKEGAILKYIDQYFCNVVIKSTKETILDQTKKRCQLFLPFISNGKEPISILNSGKLFTLTPSSET